MMDLLELNGLGKYVGGQNAPTGSFYCARASAIFQQGSDGLLPADGNIWILLSIDNTKTLTQCATLINAITGQSLTSASLHNRTSADNAQAPGTGADDA